MRRGRYRRWICASCPWRPSYASCASTLEAQGTRPSSGHSRTTVSGSIRKSRAARRASGPDEVLGIGFLGMVESRLLLEHPFAVPAPAPHLEEVHLPAHCGDRRRTRAFRVGASHPNSVQLCYNGYGPEGRCRPRGRLQDAEAHHILRSPRPATHRRIILPRRAGRGLRSEQGRIT